MSFQQLLPISSEHIFDPGQSVSHCIEAEAHASMQTEKDVSTSSACTGKHTRPGGSDPYGPSPGRAQFESFLCVENIVPRASKRKKDKEQESTTVTHDTVEVQLQQGRISGVREEIAGVSFYGFRGIPYAQPPTGELRLQDPVAAEAWEGVRDGSVAPPLCPQLTEVDGETAVAGQEDCLYLSVYTSRAYPSDMPVMVLIHGGGFLVGGSEEQYPPMPLLKRDVVLVVLQYRLGTLGFLSTEDAVMPGNLGLKDQTLGLLWVKENIRVLGGDPFRVTLFGQGAGSAAAHMQVLSPKAAGLFNRVILQSGNALSPWALRCDHRKNAAVIGEAFGCPGVNASSPADLNSTALLDCLRELPFEQLTVIPSAFVVWLNAPQVMTPRVDGTFLPAHPAHLLKDGLFNRVSLISGINQQEGALPALATLTTPFLNEALTENFSQVGPIILNVQDEENAVFLSRRAFNAYLPQYQVNEDTVGDFAKLLGDEAFRVPHREVVRLHSKAGGLVFAYELKHRGLQSLTDLFNTSAGDSCNCALMCSSSSSEVTPNLPSYTLDRESWGYWRVSNGDDLQYLFNGTIFPPLRNLDDRRLSDLIVIMWTNFAATGYPTPDNALGFWWSPVRSCSPLPYLCLMPTPIMAWDGRSSMYEFWTSLPTFQNRVLNPQYFTHSSGGFGRPLFHGATATPWPNSPFLPAHRFGRRR
ncbi:juvenile hormone esterase-like [Penaeus indicus]|uniref:juvenile hormone esterase-like n=1 Tax=Penaeus indicus TaxID=29960 RepID=UPI00300C73C0